MRTHPAAPLTTANELHYWKLNMAKELLEDEKDIENRIKLRGIVGQQSSEILRLKRKGTGKAMSNPIESKLVIQYLDDGEWKKLSEYGLNDIRTAYNVYNQLTAQTLDKYRLVNVKVDLLATNQEQAK